MPEVESTFDTYAESGSKISRFKNFFDSLENIKSGGLSSFNKIKSLVDTIKSGNLGIDKFIKDTLDLNKLGLNDFISDRMASMGFTPEAISFVNGYTDKLLSAGNSAVFSIYKTAESFAMSGVQSLYSTVIGKVYVPETVFLKLLQMTRASTFNKAQINYRNNYIRKICLRQDLIKVLTWIDNEENTSYTLGESRAKDAIIAAKSGAHQVAEYIMDKILVDYKVVQSTPALTEEEMESKESNLLEYESYFHFIVKEIIVNSYSNLTTSNSSAIITDILNNSNIITILKKYQIKPSEFGTTGTKFNNKYTISTRDINILAPFYKNVNSEDTTKYINPRNKYIKEIYIILTSTRYFAQTDILVNVPLYERLSYPIISTLQKALDEAKSTFNNSALGKFIQTAEDSIEGSLYEITKKMKDFLFNPKKQTFLSMRDTVVLPEPATPATLSSTTNMRTVADIATTEETAGLPTNPSILNGISITYDNYTVYQVLDTKTDEEIITDVFNINKSGKYSTFHTRSISKYIYNIEENTTSIETLKFYIFVTSSLFGYEETIINIILNYVISKYLVDKYSDEIVFNDLISMFLELPINDFSEYNENRTSGSTLIINQEDDGNGGIILYGKRLNYSTLKFYNTILTPDNLKLEFDNSTLYVKDTYNNIIRNFTSRNGLGVGQILGLSFDNYGNIYVLMESGVSTSFDSAITFTFDSNVNIDAMSIIGGSGNMSLLQLVFYKVFYYNNTFYHATTDLGVKYTSNNGLTYNYITTNENLPSNNIYGITIANDNMLYVLLADGLYTSSLTDISSFKKISNYIEGLFNLSITGVGSINNAIQIPYFSLDDIDINNPIVRKAVEDRVLGSQQILWIYDPMNLQNYSRWSNQNSFNTGDTVLYNHDWYTANEPISVGSADPNVNTAWVPK